MFDKKILDCASRLIAGQFRKRWRVLPDEINSIMREKRIAGMDNSSVEQNNVLAACEKEIDERAEIVWEIIQGVHKDIGAPITNTLAKELKQEVNLHIEKIVKYASELMAKPLRLREPDPNLAYLEKTKSEVKKEYDAEVDLYVASLEQGEPEQDTKPQVKDGQSNISGMRWQDAQKKAESIVKEHGFRGFMKLKDAVGCAKATLTKAIEKSLILIKAKSKYDAMSSTLKAVGVTPKVLATYKEKSEGPQLTGIEVEEILDEMMQQVKEDYPAKLKETKLSINNMSPTEKHDLAKAYQKEYKALKKHNRTHKDEKRTFFSEPQKPHQRKNV